MTREEAARIIKLERDGLKESEKNELLKLKIDPCLYTAFDVAIQALEQEPCEDAISREAAKDLMRSLPRWCVRSEDEEYTNVGLLYDHVMFGLDNLQSVTPKTGHWIEGKYRDDDIRYNDSSYKCDKCGRIVDFKENYCPNCGARMVEP